MKSRGKMAIHYQGPRWTGSNYLDTGGAAFTHGVGHGRTRRIDHGDEAQEAELLGGEVGLVAVEVESTRKLGGGQVQVAEAWGGRGDRSQRRR